MKLNDIIKISTKLVHDAPNVIDYGLLYPKTFLLLLFSRSHQLQTTNGFFSDFFPILFLIQRRQVQPSSKSRSELFNPHREDAVSGLLVAPPKQSRPIREARAENLLRVSHSGPLVHGPGATKSGKELDCPLAISTAANLSKLSGLVATRTMFSDDLREKPGPSQPDTTERVGRFSGPIKELESRKQDYERHMKLDGDFHQIDEKACSKEPSLVSYMPCFFLHLFLRYMPQVLSNIFWGIDIHIYIYLCFPQSNPVCY